MGEYIKNPKTGEVVKIATCDDCFYSREQVLRFQAEGWIGEELGTDRDIINRLLSDPETLYRLPSHCTFDPKIHTVIIERNDIEHQTVTAQIKGNRGSVYTYPKLICAQAGEPKLWAVMIGERYSSGGKARTILRCDCCGKLFSLSEPEAENLRRAYPHWTQWIKGNGEG